MNIKYERWLPHLIDAIPVSARKNHTSLYTIALEGWRRGLGLKFVKDSGNRIVCILVHEGREYRFIGSSGEMITDEIIEICDDKGRTNEMLSKAGVPIPLGKEFGENNSNEEILRYADQISYPVVLKPTDGKAGRGVYADLKNSQELRYALTAVREKLGYKNLLLQQYVTGDEVRLYVLNGKVHAASNRRPANILGDGISTVKEAILKKNELRKKVPSLYSRPIKIDKEVHNALKSRGYTLESIPKKGERIFLRNISNLSRGGESVDILESLTEKQKEIAVKATEAIPGLVQCGVDMITNESTGMGVILELNTRPGIGNHLFPVEGYAKDIPKEIIDFYIPETKGIRTDHANVYFEFRDIIETLKEDTVSEIEVRPYPGKVTTKTLVLSGKADPGMIFNRITNLVSENNINGHFIPLADEAFELRVGAASYDDLKEFMSSLDKVIKGHKMTIEEIPDVKEPLMVGFRFIDKTQEMSLKKLKTEVKVLDEKLRFIEKERIRINRRIILMQESLSWKLSSPIRFMSDKIKRK